MQTISAPFPRPEVIDRAIMPQSHGAKGSSRGMSPTWQTKSLWKFLPLLLPFVILSQSFGHTEDYSV